MSHGCSSIAIMLLNESALWRNTAITAIFYFISRGHSYVMLQFTVINQSGDSGDSHIIVWERDAHKTPHEEWQYLSGRY